MRLLLVNDGGDSAGETQALVSELQARVNELEGELTKEQATNADLFVEAEQLRASNESLKAQNAVLSQGSRLKGLSAAQIAAVQEKRRAGLDENDAIEVVLQQAAHDSALEAEARKAEKDAKATGKK